MERCLTPYTILRTIVTLACLIFFVLQSRKEMEKYFSKVTSTSTQYMSDKEAHIRLPRIVICLANEPFKSDKYPETLEEYNNNTYSKDEVIGFIEEGYGNVTELATFYYGKCFVLEISEGKDIWFIIGLNIRKEIRLYFIDHGQDFCIIYGVLYCDVHLHNLVVEKYYNQINIRAKKTVREER